MADQGWDFSPTSEKWPKKQDHCSKQGLEQLMEQIRLKTATAKSWIDTSKILRCTSTDKKIAALEKVHVFKCMDTLQRAIKATSHSALIARLEGIARSCGLIFHAGPTDCYIRGELFSLHIVLELSGKVKDVRISHNHQQGSTSSCPDLVEAISSSDFYVLIRHLKGLSSMYQVGGDRKQAKAFLALSSLEADLNTLAKCIQSSIQFSVSNYIYKTPLGIIQPRNGGCPMKLTYFVAPYDFLNGKEKTSHSMTLEAITGNNLGHSASVCIENFSPRQLQTMPLITVKQTQDGKSIPACASHNNMNSTVLPACFVLNMNKPIPVSLDTVHKIQQVTGLQCADTNKPKSLIGCILNDEALQLNGNPSEITVSLPDQNHVYVMNGLETAGVLLTKVPFIHPTHVPSILQVLRQQLIFNTLIGSIGRHSTERKDSNKRFTFEVYPLSTSQNVTVTFENPVENKMVTAEFDLTEITSVKCHLQSKGQELCSDDFACKIIQRCLAVPVTMRCILEKVFSKNADDLDNSKGKSDKSIKTLIGHIYYRNSHRNNSTDSPDTDENGNCKKAKVPKPINYHSKLPRKLTNLTNLPSYPLWRKQQQQQQQQNYHRHQLQQQAYKQQQQMQSYQQYPQQHQNYHPAQQQSHQQHVMQSQPMQQAWHGPMQGHQQWHPPVLNQEMRSPGGNRPNNFSPQWRGPSGWVGPPMQSMNGAMPNTPGNIVSPTGVNGIGDPADKIVKNPMLASLLDQESSPETAKPKETLLSSLLVDSVPNPSVQNKPRKPRKRRSQGDLTSPLGSTGSSSSKSPKRVSDLENDASVSQSSMDTSDPFENSFGANQSNLTPMPGHSQHVMKSVQERRENFYAQRIKSVEEIQNPALESNTPKSSQSSAISPGMQQPASTSTPIHQNVSNVPFEKSPSVSQDNSIIKREIPVPVSSQNIDMSSILSNQPISVSSNVKVENIPLNVSNALSTHVDNTSVSFKHESVKQESGKLEKLLKMKTEPCVNVLEHIPTPVAIKKESIPQQPLLSNGLDTLQNSSILEKMEQKFATGLSSSMNTPSQIPVPSANTLSILEKLDRKSSVKMEDDFQEMKMLKKERRDSQKKKLESKSMDQVSKINAMKQYDAHNIEMTQQEVLDLTNSSSKDRILSLKASQKKIEKKIEKVTLKRKREQEASSLKEMKFKKKKDEAPKEVVSNVAKSPGGSSSNGKDNIKPKQFFSSDKASKNFKITNIGGKMKITHVKNSEKSKTVTMKNNVKKNDLTINAASLFKPPTPQRQGSFPGSMLKIPKIPKLSHTGKSASLDALGTGSPLTTTVKAPQEIGKSTNSSVLSKNSKDKSGPVRQMHANVSSNTVGNRGGSNVSNQTSSTSDNANPMTTPPVAHQGKSPSKSVHSYTQGSQSAPPTAHQPFRTYPSTANSRDITSPVALTSPRLSTSSRPALLPTPKTPPVVSNQRLPLLPTPATTKSITPPPQTTKAMTPLTINIKEAQQPVQPDVVVLKSPSKEPCKTKLRKSSLSAVIDKLSKNKGNEPAIISQNPERQSPNKDEEKTVSRTVSPVKLADKDSGSKGKSNEVIHNKPRRNDPRTKSPVLGSSLGNSKSVDSHSNVRNNRNNHVSVKSDTSKSPNNRKSPAKLETEHTPLFDTLDKMLKDQQAERKKSTEERNETVGLVVVKTDELNKNVNEKVISLEEKSLVELENEEKAVKGALSSLVEYGEESCSSVGEPASPDATSGSCPLSPVNASNLLQEDIILKSIPLSPEAEPREASLPSDEDQNGSCVNSPKPKSPTPSIAEEAESVEPDNSNHSSPDSRDGLMIIDEYTGTPDNQSMPHTPHLPSMATGTDTKCSTAVAAIPSSPDSEAAMSPSSKIPFDVKESDNSSQSTVQIPKSDNSVKSAVLTKMPIGSPAMESPTPSPSNMLDDDLMNEALGF